MVNCSGSGSGFGVGGFGGSGGGGLVLVVVLVQATQQLSFTACTRPATPEFSMCCLAVSAMAAMSLSATKALCNVAMHPSTSSRAKDMPNRPNPPKLLVWLFCFVLLDFVLTMFVFLLDLC